MAMIEPMQARATGRINKQDTPPKGRFYGRCIYVEDLENYEMTFDGKTSFESVTQLFFGFRSKEGVPFVVRTWPMPRRITEKSKLGKFLRLWGQCPAGLPWDTQSLLGKEAELRIIHSLGAKGNSIFANIEICLPVDQEDLVKVAPLSFFQGTILGDDGEPWKLGTPSEPRQATPRTPATGPQAQARVKPEAEDDDSIPF